MLSANEVELLLAATRSEVKRWGGDHPSLLHLAFVASKKWPETYQAAFTPEQRDTLGRMLQQGASAGSEEDLVHLLRAAAGPDELVKGLAEHLGPAIRAAQDQPLAADASDPVVDEASGSPATLTPTEPGEEWPRRSARFIEPLVPREDVRGRDEQVNRVVGTIRRSLRSVPLVVGPRGAGRTALLQAVAARLAHDGDQRQVLRVGADTLGDEPAQTLEWVLDDVSRPVVLCIDDIDRIASLGSVRVDLAALLQVSAARHRDLVQLVLTVDQRYAARLDVTMEELSSELVRVALPPVGDHDVHDLALASAAQLEKAHGVTIGPDLVAAACLPRRSADLREHPGLAFDRLDAAASYAAACGDPVATTAHLEAQPEGGAPDAATLVEQLGRRIKGQDHALQAVASRLALTLARLDLRPDRPDGVFLFVGPTGVGKSEVARSLAAALFGSEKHLIRLDMSEFAQEWAISRIAGPMPGYVGSTEPEGWLTTKVAADPRCVVLLDEIEKAHPRVWNLFLQAFDAGRLTDSRGVTVDLSNVVFVMTSNMGVAEASTGAVGFGSAEDRRTAVSARILAEVRRTMAPELLNRIDEVVLFNALSPEDIADIARLELDLVRARLAEAGWSVAIDDEVAEHLARTGYDAAYGARHLQRNIERLLLTEIAEARSKAVRVRLVDGHIDVEALA